jgi:hypothetical protein
MATIIGAPGYQPTTGGLQEVARTLNGYQAAPGECVRTARPIGLL